MNVQPKYAVVIAVVALLIAIVGVVTVISAGGDALEDDNVWVGSSNDIGVPREIPDCNATTDDKLQYDQTTNAFSCDDTAGSGSGGSIETKDDGVQVSASSTVLDFRNLLTVTESPTGESNIIVEGTEAEFETAMTDATNILTNNDTLGDNGDVTISGPTAADILVRNAGNTAWVDVPISGDGTLTAAGVLNVTEADALAADPTDCAADTKADAINATGDLTCTDVDTGDIQDGTILEEDLNAVDAAVDEECATFETPGFEWQPCGQAPTFTVCAVDANTTVSCDFIADGTNDEEQIIDALDACPASGCWVFLSEGTFTIEEPAPAPTGGDVIIISDNEHVSGAGMDATSLVFATGRGLGADRYVFGTETGADYGTTNWSISNLEIVAADAQDHGIHIQGAQDGLIENVHVRHNDEATSNDEGIQFSGSGTGAVRNVTLRNVIVEDFGASLVEIASDVHDLSIYELTLRSGAGHGMFFRNGEGTEATDPRRITFWGLSSYGNATNGTLIDRGHDITFYGANMYENGGEGLSSHSPGSVSRITVIGGTFHNNDQQGIVIAGSDWILTGATIFNNGQDTGASDSNRVGLRIASDGHYVSGNRIFDDQATSTQPYAVRVQSGASSVVVSNNILGTGFTGIVLDNSTSTRFQFNQGFQRDVRFYEAIANDAHHVSVIAPVSMSADRTCTLQDDSTPFDNCVSGGAQNLFETISTTSGTSPVADDPNDTLTLTAGDGVTVTGDSSTDAVTFAVDLVDNADGTSATTASESGLEFLSSELSLIRGCSDAQLLKWVNATESWDCSADSTGGTPSFDAITSGTNTSATMVVGAGAEIDLIIGGHVEASDVLEEVNNDSGGTLFQCTPVYISGFDVSSDNPEILIADADGSGTMPATGLLLIDLANGVDGFVVTNGAFNGLDTMTAEGWTVGDILYVNDSGTSADDDCGNALTNVRPSNTDDIVQEMGTVTRVHATNGQILVIGSGHGNDSPNLLDGAFWVGNGSNFPTAVTLSGDATMTNAGVISVTEADALAADPTDCAANTYANAIAANGNLTCAAIDISGDTNLAVSGTLLDLTGDTLSLNEGTLTDNNLCDYELTGTQIECTTNTKAELEDIITDVADFAEADGDVFTGVHDFGGATSLEVPNAAGGTTVNASGEVTVDTTVGTFNLAATSTARIISTKYSKGLIVLAPVATDDFPLIRIDETFGNSSITLVEVCYLAIGGTNWVGQLNEGDANGGSGADIHTVDITAPAGVTQCTQTFSNASIDNGDWILIESTSISGTPTSLSITFYYIIDPP